MRSNEIFHYNGRDIFDVLSSYFHSAFANHCGGYNACYATGYRDGYNDAQNGLSPAYAYVGHSKVARSIILELSQIKRQRFAKLCDLMFEFEHKDQVNNIFINEYALIASKTLV